MSLRPVRRKTMPVNLADDYEIDVKIDESSSRDSRKKQPKSSKQRKKTSGIWRYFKLVVNNKYECVLCSGRLNYVGNSTSNFYRHLRLKHPSESFSASPKKRKRNSHLERYADPDIIILSPHPSVEQDQEEMQENLEELSKVPSNKSNRHSSVPLSRLQKPTENVVIEFEGENESNSVGKNEEKTCSKEVATLKAHDTNYDASQPWRFFDISSGNAACRLCFRSLIYKSVDDLHVLLDHLESEHSVSLHKPDSAEMVIREEGCESSRSSTQVEASSNCAKNLGRKFEMYYRTRNNHSATCKICLRPVCYNRKTLISHLYKEHKKVFSKKYPTYWHLARFFSNNSSTLVSTKVKFSSDERSPTQQNMTDVSGPSEPSRKCLSYSQNFAGNFLNIDGNKAKCMFCSKCLSFSGDTSILEKHILEDHKTAFVQKILEEMVFTNTNTSENATGKRAIDVSARSETQKLLNEDVLSYFKPLGNHQFECKLCSKLLSLENDESLNQLAEHVWCTHMSKTFRSIVFLQSYGISCTSKEEDHSNSESTTCQKSEKQLHSAILRTIKWVKPVGKLSDVWKYFLTADPKLALPYAKCRLCNHVLSIKSLNTSNLARHLNTKHNGVLQVNLNMLYENGRMFSISNRRRIATNYLRKELRKSVKKKCVPKVLPNKNSSRIKCKLCCEYLSHSDRETCAKHMKEQHINTYNMGVTFEQYKENQMTIMTIKEKADELESCSKLRETALKDDSHLITFFCKSASSYAKCKLCRKLISKSIHCRHRVPMIFSVSSSIKSLKKLKKSPTDGRKSVKISSRIYCSSLNIVKNYCDICLKNPMSLICRCVLRRQFVIPNLLYSKPNENCLSTLYLQDMPKSERQVYAILLSINNFEKSCCLLCPKVLQGSNLRSCLDNFWFKHRFLVKTFIKLSKSVEKKRRLIDEVEAKAYFDTPLGLKWQRPIETSANSEQPTMTVNFVSASQPSASENSVSCFEEIPESLSSSFNVMSERDTATTFDFNNENPSSNLAVVDENQTLILDAISISRNSSLNAGTGKTHSSMLAIASKDQDLSESREVEIIPENKQPTHGKRRNVSLIWKFFTRVGANTAYCNACGRIAKTSTLNNLKRHLINKHPRLAQVLKQEIFRNRSSLSIKSTINETDGRWMHYKKLNDEWAECNNCKRLIAIKNGCTSNLVRHLRSKKCVNKESDKEFLFQLANEPTVATKKSGNIWHYFQRKSVDNALCIMCQQVISIKNNNISNLSRHLRTIHKVYIVPNSKVNPQVIDLPAAPDLTTVKYKYILDEDLNITEVANNDSQTFIKTAIVESGNQNSCENFLLEETFPSYIAEEVVGVLEPIQTNESDDQDNTNLDNLMKKVHRSPSWQYFTKLPDARVKCTLCDVTLAFKSSKCINNLSRHLKTKHASAIGSAFSEPNNDKCIIYVHDANQTQPPVKTISRKRKTSFLWNYFTRSENCKVTCRICQKDLSYKSSPITNLRRHLEVKHSNVLNEALINLQNIS